MTSTTSETLLRVAVIAGFAAAAGPVLDIVLRRTRREALAQDLRRLRLPVWALAGALFLRIAADAVPRAEAWSGPVDAVIHIDDTRAVEPLERTPLWEWGDVPETYPHAV